jgi:hypothetical protein
MASPYINPASSYNPYPSGMGGFPMQAAAAAPAVNSNLPPDAYYPTDATSTTFITADGTRVFDRANGWHLTPLGMSMRSNATQPPQFPTNYGPTMTQAPMSYAPADNFSYQQQPQAQAQNYYMPQPDQMPPSQPMGPMGPEAGGQMSPDQLQALQQQLAGSQPGMETMNGMPGQEGLVKPMSVWKKVALTILSLAGIPYLISWASGHLWFPRKDWTKSGYDKANGEGMVGKKWVQVLRDKNNTVGVALGTHEKTTKLRAGSFDSGDDPEPSDSEKPGGKRQPAKKPGTKAAGAKKAGAAATKKATTGTAAGVKKTVKKAADKVVKTAKKVAGSRVGKAVTRVAKSRAGKTAGKVLKKVVKSRI